MRKIIVSDVTLKEIAKDRGGEISFREKINIAKALDALGVDGIELMEINGTKEEEIVSSTIAAAVKHSTVKIPTGLTSETLLKAWNCIKDAKDPCLQVVIPSSTVQMEYQFHMKAPKMLEAITSQIKAALAKCSKVELVLGDATRAEREVLGAMCKAAKENGACAVVLCDDAGIQMPEEFAALVKEIRTQCDIAIYVKPSDQISMAAATAAATLCAGADGIVCAAAGKEILAIDQFADVMKVRGESMGIACRLDLTNIHRGTKNLRSQLNVTTDENGETNIVHDSGMVALNKDSTLADVCESAKILGYELTDEDNGNVYSAFLRVAQKKEEVGPKELEAIIASAAMQVPSTYHLDSYVCNNGNIICATANVTLTKDEEKCSGISAGDGPIDAAFQAIEQIVGHHYELDSFQIQAVTEGHEALGSALVRLRSNGKLYSGNGISTDIVGASIRAYVNALNKIVYEEN